MCVTNIELLVHFSYSCHKLHKGLGSPIVSGIYKQSPSPHKMQVACIALEVAQIQGQLLPLLYLLTSAFLDQWSCHC